MSEKVLKPISGKLMLIWLAVAVALCHVVNGFLNEQPFGETLTSLPQRYILPAVLTFFYWLTGGKRFAFDKKMMFWVIGSVLVSIGLGTLFREVEFFKPAHEYILLARDFVSKTFMGGLKFFIVPLVGFAIYENMRSNRGAGKLVLFGGMTFVWTTLWAVLWGTVAALIVQPGVGLQITEGASEGSAASGVSSLLSALFAEPWGWIDLLWLIGVALVSGFVTGIFYKRDTVFDQFAKQAGEFFIWVLLFVLRALPLAIAFLTVGVIIEKGVMTFLGDGGTLIMTNALGMGLHIVAFMAVLALIVSSRSKWSPIAGLREIGKFIFHLHPAWLTAFFTRSSMATLPKSEECCDKAGIDPIVSRTTLPLGATVNMDGTTIGLAVACWTMLQVLGVSFEWSILGVMLGTLLGASVGTASAPSASLLLMTKVLAVVALAAGHEVSEAFVAGVIALFLTVDFVTDSLRTMTNVAGDTSVSFFLNKYFGKEVAPSEGEDLPSGETALATKVSD